MFKLLINFFKPFKTKPNTSNEPTSQIDIEKVTTPPVTDVPNSVEKVDTPPPATPVKVKEIVPDKSIKPTGTKKPRAPGKITAGKQPAAIKSNTKIKK